MNYLFGPVSSRRLGLSLGIDLVPFKTCSLNCIYCECGRTTNLTFEIDEYFPTLDVINEIRKYLSLRPKIDIITFSGSGEPTLHCGIDKIINLLKEDFPEYLVSVITNGTLLNLESVRRSIQNADMVLPSLDAVTEEVFNKIARPVKGITAQKIIDGLIKFRREFRGKIILEIFIVPKVNNTETELKGIRQACLKINPDKIHLNTIDRPGTEEWIEPATIEELFDIKSLLAPLEVEIIGKPVYKELINLEFKNIKNAVISTIERRPSTIQDLSVILGVKISELTKVITQLSADNVIEKINLSRGGFYRIKKAKSC